MARSVAVTFEHVSKRFVLQSGRSRSFQEAVVNFFRRGRDASPSGQDTGPNGRDFWALKDVSFELEHGKTIGLIGANGAGKSTALKLIARIVEPTSGHIQTEGRIGALLELGAGFHPDLTGRENIYLNGSILGLSREQIRSKLDEMIAFAELDRFIDVPVKHYSSGMYVRLGFSVAVHTDPEILLVDEVLAVGDANFQRKCMDRIATLRRSGVTIVLVSHGLETIQSLCDYAIWFDRGEIQYEGQSTDVVMAYLNHLAEHSTMETQGFACDAEEMQDLASLHGRRWGTGKVRIVGVEFRDRAGERTSTFKTGEPMAIHLRYRARERVEAPVFGLALHHQNGAHICGPNTNFGGLDIPLVEGEGEVVYRIPSMPLLEGTYLLSVAVHEKSDIEMYDYQDRLYPFRVYPGQSLERYGLVTLNGSWHRVASGMPVP